MALKNMPTSPINSWRPNTVPSLNHSLTFSFIHYQTRTTQNPEWLCIPWRINPWLLNWAIFPSLSLKNVPMTQLDLDILRRRPHFPFLCTTCAICSFLTPLRLYPLKLLALKSISNAASSIKYPHTTSHLTPKPSRSRVLISGIFESTFFHWFILRLLNDVKALSTDNLL